MKVTYIKLFPNRANKMSNLNENKINYQECNNEYIIHKKNKHFCEKKHLSQDEPWGIRKFFRLNKIYGKNKLLNVKELIEDKKNKEKGNTMKYIKKSQIALISLSLMLMTAGYLNYTNNIKVSDAELGDARLVSTNTYTSNSINSTNNEINSMINNDINSESSSNSTTNENTDNNIDSANSIANETNLNDNNNLDNSTVDTANKNVNSDESDSKTISTDTEISASANNSNKANNDQYFAQTKLERDTMYSQMLETYQKILENEKIPSDQKSIASNEIKNINDRKNAIAIVENLIKTKGFENIAILINDNSINVVVKKEGALSQEQVAQIENIVSRELKADIEDIHITTHK